MTYIISGYSHWVRNFTLSFGEGWGEAFIGGGQNNCIADSASLLTYYGVIGGGESNCIFPGTNHASIFSGNGNTVAGSCSVVLGGLNNGDGGFPNTAVFGNTLVASVDPATMGVPSAFWTDELIVPNMPIGTAGPTAPAVLPTGGLWYYPDASGNCVVYIK